MRNTKRTCERDLKQTYLQIVNNKKQVEIKAHNYKFQHALAKPYVSGDVVQTELS